jgi:hypothetical protein
VLNRSCLSAVRPENKSVQSSVSPEVVEHRHVGVHVVDVVGVGRVLVVVPHLRGRNVTIEQRVLGLALVVHGIQADDISEGRIEVILCCSRFITQINMI